MNLVTENYLRLNFTPLNGITPGTDDHDVLNCTEILSRYNVEISPSTGRYCPKQSELTASEVIAVSNPDFIVMKYLWSSHDGVDLDTATEFINSNIAELDYMPVGWRMGSSNRANILLWGGDNRDSGNETTYVDIQRLKTYPQLAEISHIDVYGNWYESRGVGNVGVELKSYQGGIMSLVGFTWTNTGGTLIDTSLIVTNVYALHSHPGYFRNHPPMLEPGYTHMGYITYNKTTEVAKFNI